jgi:glutaminyl-tRNA synthetase
MDVISVAYVEAAVAEGKPGEFYQFERNGYFCHDLVDSQPGRPVLNRVVTLRDSWARSEQEPGRKSQSG